MNPNLSPNLLKQQGAITPQQQVAFVRQQPLHVVFNNINNEEPPYAQLIINSITALKNQHGSSRQAINKHMQGSYTGEFPANHQKLLTKYLQRMRAAGTLVLLKHSYAITASGTMYVPLIVSKHRQGRPPKTKNNGQNLLVPFGPKSHAGASQSRPNAKNMLVSVGVGEGPSAAKGGRGKPPKAPESSSKMVVVQGGKPKGRAPKALGRSPKKLAAPGGVTVKKSGKQSGRPEKSALVLATEEAAKRTQAVRNKILFFQSRVKRAIHLVKPYLPSEHVPIAYRALLELEELANSDLISPTQAQDQQPPSS